MMSQNTQKINRNNDEHYTNNNKTTNTIYYTRLNWFILSLFILINKIIIIIKQLKATYINVILRNLQHHKTIITENLKMKQFIIKILINEKLLRNIIYEERKKYINYINYFKNYILMLQNTNKKLIINLNLQSNIIKAHNLYNINNKKFQIINNNYIQNLYNEYSTLKKINIYLIQQLYKCNIRNNNNLHDNIIMNIANIKNLEN